MLEYKIQTGTTISKNGNPVPFLKVIERGMGRNTRINTYYEKKNILPRLQLDIYEKLSAYVKENQEICDKIYQESNQKADIAPELRKIAEKLGMNDI